MRVLPLALVVIVGCHPRLPPGTFARTLAFGGAQRTYLVHPGAPRMKDALVLVLHGMGGSGANIERRTHFDTVADKQGFVVAYPDALERRWSDGWDDGKADDVGFLAALADALVAEYSLDPDRVYVAGFSNGASMAHRLACERETVAAFAAVSGTMARSVRGPCAKGRAISLLGIHGKDDPIVPFDDEVLATVDVWRKRNGCGPSDSSDLPDADPSDGTRIHRDRNPCRDGAVMEFFTIAGGGHAWPGGEPTGSAGAGRTSRDMDASVVIWDFFSRQKRLLKQSL
jgi:polyhydroxybutyrate depolymerase